MPRYALLLLLLPTLFLTNPAFADSPEDYNPDSSSNSKWVLSISGGPDFGSAGQTQTFYLTPSIEKTYEARNAGAVFANAEFYIGMQKPLDETFVGQLGLVMAYTGNANPQGVIDDDANPEFANYSYQYKVSHRYVGLQGKILIDQGGNNKFIPWISASAGPGYNQAHDFTNTPSIEEAIQNNNFSDHNSISFSYTVGAGVQMVITPHCQLGLSYEYADWGKAQLGKASAQTLHSGLNIDHLHASSVLLNLTFLG